MKKPVVAIHVWLDALAAQDRGLDEYYSVSEVDADGEEIRCIRGFEDLARAWQIARAHADCLGVPAIEYATESNGVATDRYTPEAKRDE